MRNSFFSCATRPKETAMLKVCFALRQSPQKRRMRERMEDMRFLPTGKWMGMADTHTIQEIGIPSLVLMERAALSCLEALKREGMNLEHTLIVCGSGNNGGDGLVLARLLHEEGRQVTVVFAGRMASRSGECKKQMEILERLGIGIHTEIPKEAYSLVVDAVFGVGLGRPIEGTYRQLILEMN